MHFPSSQLAPDDYQEYVYTCLPEEMDVDVSPPPLDAHFDMKRRETKGHTSFFFPGQTKLSRMCELDKVLRTHEEKIQQLYREKVTFQPRQ